MADLLPAGGTGKWTKTACEKLEKIFEKFEMMVSVEIVGRALNGTIPVKIYVKQVTGPDALFINVEEELVSAGLAIPAVNRLARPYTHRTQQQEGESGSHGSAVKSGEAPVLSEPKPTVEWLPPVEPDSSFLVASKTSLCS